MDVDQQHREVQALSVVAERLCRSFSERRSAAEVEHAVDAAYRRFNGKPIRDFVPVLVERFARDELRTPEDAVSPASSVTLERAKA